MPRSRVQTGSARLPGRFADEHGRLAEQTGVDVCAPGPHLARTHFDDGGCRDEQRHEGEAHERPADEGDGLIDGGQHQRRHRCDQRSADESPQRGAQSFSVQDIGRDAASCVLHYPRCVADSVDVPIIASEIPVYAHPGDAGADLVASEAVSLAPGQRALVGTGVRIALPEGYVAFVVPRSGLAAKHGITIVNAPGTVDAGYRGEIKVSLLNTDATHSFDVAVGDRIAQLIVMPVPRVQFIPVDELPGSSRGEGGFGSTGLASAATNRDGATA